MSTRPRWRPARAPGSAGSLADGPRATALTIPCMRFDATRAFYADAVGLPIGPPTGGRVTLDLGELRLVLIDASRMARFERGDGQGLYLEVAVPDLNAARARLVAAGAEVFAPARGNGRLLTAQDPEGNLVNLVAAGPAGRPQG